MKIYVKIIIVSVLFFLFALTLFLFIVKKQTSMTPSRDKKTNAAVAPPLDERKVDTPEILEKYGRFAFETFQRYPAIADQARELDNNFTPSQMDPSYPSHVYRLKDGKEYLLLGGCTEHNCSGTKIIVAYNITENKVTMGKEIGAGNRLLFLGNPSDQEADIMTEFYLQK